MDYSMSLTISWSLPKFMSIASVMPSNHLILCCPLLLLPSIFPSIRVFFNEPAVLLARENKSKNIVNRDQRFKEIGWKGCSQGREYMEVSRWMKLSHRETPVKVTVQGQG